MINGHKSDASNHLGLSVGCEEETPREGRYGVHGSDAHGACGGVWGHEEGQMVADEACTHSSVGIKVFVRNLKAKGNALAFQKIQLRHRQAESETSNMPPCRSLMDSASRHIGYTKAICNISASGLEGDHTQETILSWDLSTTKE